MVVNPQEKYISGDLVVDGRVMVKLNSYKWDWNWRIPLVFYEHGDGSLVSVIGGASRITTNSSNILRMDLSEIRWEDVDQDRDQWRILVNMVLDFQVP